LLDFKNRRSTALFGLSADPRPHLPLAGGQPKRSASLTVFEITSAPMM
jgi:hypothetical protein